ncbi:hypothetical protein PVAND_002109 [Polypedilum vanderplanki]|uniref:Uncharacterized protein n=1 Tax=Polypedilum vanderplanki TaxID=319348 RepID=A0A9J6BQI5_POLVA|nr:hypothetical protein PVAND_002109 [Polypedilum vanderplanki]
MATSKTSLNNLHAAFVNIIKNTHENDKINDGLKEEFLRAVKVLSNDAKEINKFEKVFNAFNKIYEDENDFDEHLYSKDNITEFANSFGKVDKNPGLKKKNNKMGFYLYTELGNLMNQFLKAFGCGWYKHTEEEYQELLKNNKDQPQSFYGSTQALNSDETF